MTPRKAASFYQVANSCLRSSGSLGGFFALAPRPCRRYAECEKPQQTSTGLRFHVLGQLVEHVVSHAEHSSVSCREFRPIPST